MMRTLLVKELRALRPFAWCIVGLLIVSVIYVFATELPDEQLFVPAKWLAEDRSGYFITIALFALMIGAGLLIGESDQGTLRFLDGLPVSRSRLFVAKTLAAWAVVMLTTVLGLPLDVLIDSFSRSSADGPFTWAFLGAQAWLQAVAGLYLLAFGMALSFARSWFALIAGSLFWGYLWLRQKEVPNVELFDPNALLAVGLDGTKILIPWGHVLAQSVAALVLLGVAWLAFLSLGDRAQFASERLGKWRVWRFCGAGLRWLAPVVWIAALVQLLSSMDPGKVDDPNVPLGEHAFARQETAHYEFLFRSAQRQQAEPLLAVADQVHDAVAAFLDAPPPARIVVDLASAVMPHAAGQTNWTKIRMPLAERYELNDLRPILAHETAHVFIEQLSDGRLAGHFSSVRFLHEGLATYVEQIEQPDDAAASENRRSVAGAWARGRVSFALLCDDEALSRQRDPNLAYPLGEVFVRALVEAHGKEAVTRLLRAFARRNAPMGLSGMALWRDTMQAAGLDLDRVIGGYESGCAQIAEAEKDFVARLPRLSATVGMESGEVVIRPFYEGAAPGELLCLIKVEGPLMTETPPLAARADGSFAFPRSRSSGPTVSYLLGWRTKETRLPVFEPWVEKAP